jgi:hypothetical protein
LADVFSNGAREVAAFDFRDGGTEFVFVYAKQAMEDTTPKTYPSGM